MGIGRQANRIAALSLVIALAACAPRPPLVSNGVLAIALAEGQASIRRYNSSQEESLPATVQLGWNDDIATSPDNSAVLRLADDTLITLNPETRISLRRPYPPDERPVLRLLSGAVHVVAQDSDLLVESYREVPISLRIALINMVLEPKGSSSDFSLGFEGDMASAQVKSGEVDVRAGADQGTLMARWRAELAPNEALRIIPPPEVLLTLSPAPTATHTATPTLTRGTPTAVATVTRTATATRVIVRPTRTVTLAVTPTAVSRPTDTPGSGGGGGGPKPQPTAIPPTAVPPTAVPPTAIPPTAVPPTAPPRDTPPPPTSGP
jgi:hypothetical protein